METSPNPDEQLALFRDIPAGEKTVYQPTGRVDHRGYEVMEPTTVPVEAHAVTWKGDALEVAENPVVTVAESPPTVAVPVANLAPWPAPEISHNHLDTRAESAQRLSSLAARLDRMANRVESGRQHYESAKERAVISARRLGSFANSLALASREKYHNLAPTRLRRVGRLATAAAGGLRDNIAEAHADNLGISASLNSINADQIRRGAQLDPTLNPEAMRLAAQRQEHLAEIKRARAAKTRNKIAARQYRRQIRQQRLMARAANRQPSRTAYTTGLRTAA